MTSTLATLRRDLTDQITEAGLPTFSYLPERIQPPTVLLSAGDPYLERAATFCDYIVNIQATLVASKGTNTIETDDLDGMIEKIILGVDAWSISAVGAPFSLEANNAQYLAVRVNLNTDTSI